LADILTHAIIEKAIEELKRADFFTDLDQRSKQTHMFEGFARNLGRKGPEVEKAEDEGEVRLSSWAEGGSEGLHEPEPAAVQEEFPFHSRPCSCLVSTPLIRRVEVALCLTPV
jgi:hypothetical protein